MTYKRFLNLELLPDLSTFPCKLGGGGANGHDGNIGGETSRAERAQNKEPELLARLMNTLIMPKNLLMTAGTILPYLVLFDYS